MAANNPGRRSGTIFGLLVLTVIVGAAWSFLKPKPGSLVVYCAHDLVYAEEVLRDFERESGIPIVIVPDTEATKSLGLVQRLLRERDHPACDVFWNNEILGSVELARQDVLEAYRGSGWERIPDRFKDADGLWTGFGGRLRVWIVNTDNMSADEAAIAERMAGDLSRVAIAEPMFGTTLTQYSVLWDEMGRERLQAWHHDLNANGAKFVKGNGAVKDLVASGVCDFGMTDTDDFFVAKDDGKPAAMLPLRTPSGKTICIPNTVAIVRGTKKRASAEQLVDYLLSGDVELRLAAAKARQVPLGPVDESKLAEDVKPLAAWAAESVDFAGLVDARAACLTWLTQESAP